MSNPNTLPPQPARHNAAAISIFAAIGILLYFAFALTRVQTAPPPFGIPARVAWTTSRVSGSPEAPSPFETQRVFPNISFEHPVDIAFAPGINRIFIALQKGQLFSFPNTPTADHADLFFDPSELLNWEKIPNCKGMGGVLALTFHPRFQENRYCFVQYNLDYTNYARNHENGSRISRFTVTNTDPPRLDPKSEVVILQWLSGGHNGCTLKFGLDGFLYLSTGDAADPNPPDSLNTGQDISDLLSSILRIDVDHPGADKPYSIPKDNPFVSTPKARPEVFAYGLRNPFRMNFDSKTGNLWVGDVGWELWESIVCAKPGGNYGWSIVEGPNSVHPNGKRGPTEISKPQAALFHTEAASITGGVVYRGKKLPELYGYYIFGDWQTSRLWSAKCVGEKEDTLEPYKEIAQTDQRIVSFGEDPDLEPIIVDHGGGGLYRIVRNPAAGQPPTFPRKLSETGLFTSLKDQIPAAGVLPFSVNAAQWADGAVAQRFVATPGTSTMTWGKGVWGDDKPMWPKDSVLVRTLSLEMKAGNPASKKNVETQLLHFDGRQWHGYSFAWNDSQTDAELIGAGGDERPFDIVDPAAPGGSRHQIWHYPSRTQCMTCHNVWCDYALAFTVSQLTRKEKYRFESGETFTDDPARSFRHIGLLIEPKTRPTRAQPRFKSPPPEKPALTDPYDESADLAERARSYLHVNCSHCHRFGGGGTALFDVRKDLPLKQLKAVDERPALGDFGLDNGKLICPGDPNCSVFLYRTSKLGRGRMPHIGSDVVDEKGTQLLRQWIAEMPRTDSKSKPDAALLKARTQREFDVAALAMESDSSARIDRLLATPSGAQALLGEIESRALPEPVRKAALAKAIAAPQENVRDLFRRFDPREQFIVRLGPNIDRTKLLALPGDATRGRAVFESAAATAPVPSSGGTPATAVAGLCITCHRVNGQGKDFGPELSHIATKYNKAQLLENIVEPSKTIAEGFAMHVLKKTSGEIVTGLLVSKSDTEVVLRDQEKQIHVPAAEVQRLTPQPVSAMPEGLLSNLTPQEAADLLEFLSTLK